eukprot:TRINITY_DN46962_c0_g1_i1.p1 TRINITY_DN46962_c0_g1~~TRINITY_DN46962_c0_g1_i1.p1  ORF type:complete len:322 (+),score=31.81 TRINITY_DN46962_c0_g1_i1:102-968(+)
MMYQDGHAPSGEFLSEVIKYWATVGYYNQREASFCLRQLLHICKSSLAPDDYKNILSAASHSLDETLAHFAYNHLQDDEQQRPENVNLLVASSTSLTGLEYGLEKMREHKTRHAKFTAYRAMRVYAANGKTQPGEDLILSEKAIFTEKSMANEVIRFYYVGGRYKEAVAIFESLGNHVTSKGVAYAIRSCAALYGETSSREYLDKAEHFHEMLFTLNLTLKADDAHVAIATLWLAVHNTEKPTALYDRLIAIGCQLSNRVASTLSAASRESSGVLFTKRILNHKAHYF